jgi:hypothetical protein
MTAAVAPLVAATRRTSELPKLVTLIARSISDDPEAAYPRLCVRVVTNGTGSSFRNNCRNSRYGQVGAMGTAAQKAGRQRQVRRPPEPDGTKARNLEFHVKLPTFSSVLLFFCVRFCPARSKLVAAVAAPDHHSRRHGACDARGRPGAGRETPAQGIPSEVHVEAAEVSAAAVAEVAGSASALEVAAGVDAQDAAWAGGDSTAWGAL